jgi:hypothetical protein
MTMADDSQRHDADTQAGEWAALPDAMRRLSVSQRTLFRRIARGQLQRRTGPSGRVEVWVPLTDGSAASDDSQRQDGQAEQIERGLALIERFNVAVREQVAPLVLMVKEQQAINSAQAEELGRLRERVATLEHQLSLAVTAPSENVPIISSGNGVTPRPWWQFWRG